jgi:hypothetical protein
VKSRARHTIHDYLGDVVAGAERYSKALMQRVEIVGVLALQNGGRTQDRAKLGVERRHLLGPFATRFFGFRGFGLSW